MAKTVLIRGSIKNPTKKLPASVEKKQTKTGKKK